MMKFIRMDWNLLLEAVVLLLICRQYYSECVHEKGYCINGGRTKNSYCIPWRQSTRYSADKIFENTTLCKSGKGGHWCATLYYRHNLQNYNWDYCIPSNCTLSYDLCRDGISWETSDKSVKLKIPHKFDTVIIWEKSQSECAISAQCRDCKSVRRMIGETFNGCQLAEINGDPTKSISLQNLQHSTRYSFYILPIKYERLSGFVFNVTIKTKISNPCLHDATRIVSRETNSITIQWTECPENATFGRTEGYSIKVTGHSTTSFNTTETSHQINQLSPCKQYCITIYAYNEAGYSRQPVTVCTFTKPYFDEVKAVRIREISRLTRMIEWDYEDKHNCAVTFLVRLVMDTNGIDAGYFTTVNKFINLENLIPNKRYSGQITPEFNNEKGQHSPIQPFHTIQKPSNPEKINVKEKKQTSIWLEWEKPIINDMFGDPEGYEISYANLLNQVSNTTQTYYNITDLISCTKYCLSIQAYNVAGKSPQAQATCVHTKIDKFDHVIMRPFEMNQTSSVTVKWTYPNTVKCEDILFEVAYYKVNDIGSMQRLTTRYKSASLDYIEASVIYKVMVRPKYQEQYGDYSDNIEIIVNKGYSSKNKLLLFLAISIVLVAVLILGWITKTRIINNKNKQTKFESPYLLAENISHSNYERTGNKSNEKDDSESKEQSKRQFKDLGLQARKYENINNYTTLIGQLEWNKSKNRFVNILPYDQTRVVLQNKSKLNDYINANYISFADKRDKYEFIACQGPIKDSISDFWDMIWENRVTIIVMLTRTYEENKLKCLQYWPDSEREIVNFGDNPQYEISIEEELNRNSFIERKLKVLNKDLNEQRIIIHLHMVEWFDYSAPKLEDFEQLLFYFQDITLRADYHPILVHCSAGVGRTGTFIVLDRIIRKIMQGKSDINISEEILEVSKYRKMMVQRVIQLDFIRDFVAYFHNKYSYKTDIDHEENLYFNS